ncbi:hypothetical protein [Halorhabdus rudnickae]|uniref:hypothetical protein n=1 Tax=Halorhabdus rudnickae TaxID=1775544 RepID=UPI001082EA00|nr:hypothetical protein [Halorhabdus rudnickae]
MPELAITETQQDRLEVVRREVQAAYVEAYGETRPRDALEYLLDTYTSPEKREVIAAYEELATAEYPTLQQVASDIDEVPGSGIGAAEMRGRLLAALGPETLAEHLRAANTGSDDEETLMDSDADSEETLMDSDADSEATLTDNDADPEATLTDNDADPEATRGSDGTRTTASGLPVGDGAVTREASSDTAPNTGASADTSPAEETGGETSPSGPMLADSAGEESPTGNETDEKSLTEDEIEQEAADQSGADSNDSPNDGDVSTSEDQTGSPAASPLASVNKLLDDHSEKWRRGESDAPYEVDLPDGTTESARTKDDVRQLLFRHY